MLGMWLFCMILSFAGIQLIQKIPAEPHSVLSAIIDLSSYVFGHALAIAFVVYMFKRKGISFFQQISMNLKSLDGDLNRAIRLASLAVFGTLAIYIVMGLFLPMPDSGSSVRDAAMQYRGVAFFIFSSMGVIFAPIMEEVLDRGFLFNACREGFNRLLPADWMASGAAIVLSGALFAATHLTLAGFSQIFVMGMMLAFLYRYSGSLIPSMILHAMVNFIAFMQAVASLPQ